MAKEISDGLDLSDVDVGGHMKMVPENETCIHSLYPEKSWCTLLDISAAVKGCSSCEEYTPRDKLEY